MFLVTILPGDYNRDNKIHFEDSAIINGNFGLNPATYEQGDGDGNGKDDLTDFQFVSQNFSVNWQTWTGPAP